MKKPTLSHFAQLAEVVAAVAVVVSLVYVGRELRSNTAAVRAASLQGVANSSAGILLAIAADSSLARIRQVGGEDVSALTDAEAFRFNIVMRETWLTLQNVYFQHELGVMDPRVWSGYRRIICEAWSRAGIRGTWPLHRHALDPGFAAVVEACPVG